MLFRGWTLVLALFLVAGGSGCINKGTPIFTNPAETINQDAKAEADALLDADGTAEQVTLPDAEDIGEGLPGDVPPEDVASEVDAEQDEIIAEIEVDAETADVPVETPDPCKSVVCGDNVCNSDCNEDLPLDVHSCKADCCTCGDGKCVRNELCGETGLSCPSDCCKDKCGDGFCDFTCGENDSTKATWCKADCCVKGDGICGDGQDGRPACGESEHTAPEDCCRCGDGACLGTCPGDSAESLDNCPQDCSVCGDGRCVGKKTIAAGPDQCLVDCCGGCGDGICRGGECGETPENCAVDCGKYACGNGTCDPGETKATCPEDCTQNACGNKVCEPQESPQTCKEDCGTACGNGVCEPTEDKFACPQDCGTCGDGILSVGMGETIDNCPQDACNDQNPCTDDTWYKENGVTKCAHTPAASGSCDDGNVCTVGDFCKDGACQPGKDANTCDDANPCTADSCDTFAKKCVHTFKADGACPDDGNVCTDNLCVLDVDGQGNPGCGVDPVTGTGCDDQDPCTLVDQCQNGVCKGYGANTCDDQNECTKDTCVAHDGCYHNNTAYNGNSCTPATSCTTGVPKCQDAACLCQ